MRVTNTKTNVLIAILVCVVIISLLCTTSILLSNNLTVLLAKKNTKEYSKRPKYEFNLGLSQDVAVLENNVTIYTEDTIKAEETSKKVNSTPDRRADLLVSYSVPDIIHQGVTNDFIGTISIPDLHIQESVYFTGDNYYLTHDRYGQLSKAGELYIDPRSNKNMDSLDHLINGHSMNNGDKFGKLLHSYKLNKPFYIYLKTYEGVTYIYEAFALNLIPNNETAVTLSFDSAYEREKYYKYIKSTSLLKTDDIDLKSSILTLNTCDESIKEGHLLVTCVLRVVL